LAVGSSFEESNLNFIELLKNQKRERAGGQRSQNGQDQKRNYCQIIEGLILTME